MPLRLGYQNIELPAKNLINENSSYIGVIKMKQLSTKDLGLIFFVALVYIITVTVFPHIKVSKFLLNTIFLILIFLLSGYTLTAIVYPDEGCKKILKKPVLILELGAVFTVTIALVMKYFLLEANLRFLVVGMSFFTMILSLGAVIGRIRYIKSHEERIYYVNDEIQEALRNNVNEVCYENDERLYDLEDIEYEKAPQRSESSHVDEVPKTHYSFKSGLEKDLLTVDLLIVLTAISLLIHSLNKTLVVDVLGAFFIALIPGYLIMKILFPKKEDVERLELLGLGIGLSLVITSTIGLILNYTIFGINLKAITASLVILSVFLVAAAHIRRMKS